MNLNDQQFRSKLSDLGKSVFETLQKQKNENKALHKAKSRPKATLVYNRNDIEVSQNIFEPMLADCGNVAQRTATDECVRTEQNNDDAINWDDMFDEIISQPNKEQQSKQRAKQSHNSTRKRRNTTNIKQWLHHIADDDTQNNKRPRVARALVQTQLANKGGVMKYATPANTAQCTQTQQ